MVSLANSLATEAAVCAEHLCAGLSGVQARRNGGFQTLPQWLSRPRQRAPPGKIRAGRICLRKCAPVVAVAATSPVRNRRPAFPECECCFSPRVLHDSFAASLHAELLAPVPPDSQAPSVQFVPAVGELRLLRHVAKFPPVTASPPGTPSIGLWFAES